MKVKRILAAVVAVAMMLSMSVVSFAAPADAPEYDYEVLESGMAITATDGWNGPAKAMVLDGVMKFTAKDDYDAALESAYADWAPDFEITFDQDVTATLAGNYGTYGWIALPEYDFKAGETVKIMEATGLNAQVGTYADVVLLVKEFICGIDFADGTPSDAKASLSLNLTNPTDADDKFVVGEKVFDFTPVGALPQYKATVMDDAAIAATGEDLDFGMVFEAVDDYNAALANPYAGWIADFEISFNVDTTAELIGQYDNYSADWVSLGNYDFAAGEKVKVLETANLGEFTYADIVLLVEKFQCGVKLAAGSADGTEVTLSLGLTDPVTGDSVVVAEEAYEYEAPAPAYKATVMDADAIAATGQALDYGIVFEAVEDYDAALANPYADWIADFEISFDADTTAELVGQYGSYAWTTLGEYDFEAGKSYKVLETANLGEFTYADIVLLVEKFQCGIILADGSNANVTLSLGLTDATTGEVITVVEETIAVDGSTTVEDAAVLKLEETASAAADETVYNVVLAGNTANWVSGEFTVTVTDGFDYTYAPAANLAANPLGAQTGETAYNINLTSYDPDAAAADADIPLGTLTVKNYGAGTVTLSDVLMMKEDGSDENIAVELDTTVEGPYDFENIEPSHEVAVKVIFNNKIENVEAAYNEMKVTITTDGVATEFDLGSDNADVVYDATECAYTVKVDVKEMHTFDIKVEGAGYRTATYANTMYAADRLVTFWNNYKTNGAVMDVANNQSLVNVNFLAGDVYDDGVIDTTDLAAVVGEFGKTATAEHDLNRDSKIDSKDVAYVLVSWGK